MIDVPEMFELFLAACPGAHASWKEHCQKSKPRELPYLGVAVFAHHLVDCVRLNELDQLPPVFETVERLILEGDPEVRSLATIGFLEDVQNIASWQPFGNKVFRPYLGPASLAAWEEIEEIWRGKSSLMDVLRAEAKQGSKG